MKKQNDFFSLYHQKNHKQYLVPGALALLFAFGVVSFINSGADMRGLMASVANVSQAPAPADLIIEQGAGSLKVLFGAKAQSVSSVEFTILGDPDRLHNITSGASNVHVTGQQEIGAYRIVVDLAGANLMPYSPLAELSTQMQPGTPLAITDAEFTSGGKRYTLSNIIR